MTSRARTSRFAAIGSVLAAIIVGTFGGFGAKLATDNVIENARLDRERAARQARYNASNELLAVADGKARAVSLINPIICESSESGGETCPSGMDSVLFDKPQAPSVPSSRNDSDLIAYAQELETYVREMTGGVAQLNRLCETEAELVCAVSTTTTTVRKTTTTSEPPLSRFPRTGGNVGTEFERQERRQRELVDTYTECRPTGQSSSWSGESLYCTRWGVYDDGTTDKVDGWWSN